MDSQAYISQATTLRQKAVESSRRYGAPAEEAEDIAQETMIRLWQVSPKIDTRQKAEALAVCIAHNLTIDWLRREKRRAPQEEIPTESSDSHCQADTHLEEQETDEWLRKQLADLPSTEYTVLHLRQVEGLDNRAIAQRLGIEERSVATLLSRARRRLLEEIRKRRKQS